MSAAFERRRAAWKARRAWSIADDGTWITSATELHSAISMLNGAGLEFRLAWKLGPCAVVDEELATYTAMVSTLPNGAGAAWMAIVMRADLDKPKNTGNEDADQLQWGVDWQYYRSLFGLAERANIERHRQLTDEQRAAWLRGAS